MFGKTVSAYLPNPGRLSELLLPGVPLYLVTVLPSSSRKLGYMVTAVERRGRPVFLHTHATNRVVQYLIEKNRIPGLKGYQIVQPEFSVGKSRFDFMLGKGKERRLLEVKSCTLFGERIAMFPDAVTERGKRHLEELAHHAKNGLKGSVLFVVHSPDVGYFLPDYHTDLHFSRVLLAVRGKISIHAVAVTWREDLSLGEEVHPLSIPWGLIEEEARDRGSYFLLLRLKEEQVIQVGKVRQISFPAGYYLYVGSAMQHLSKRVERHKRRRKKFHWHIDYLRDRAEFVSALPVRASVSLECEIAKKVGSIADWKINSFGCSDCSCATHLFGMNENPLHMPSFQKVLLHFRIDRLIRQMKIQREES